MNNYIQIQNKGFYTARVIIIYANNGMQFSVNSGNIPTYGMSGMNIPSTATNLQISVQMYNCTSWVSFYNTTLNQASSLMIVLSGTISSPQCNILPQVGDTTSPSMSVVQTVIPSVATIGQCITVTNTVTNTKGANANGVNLMLTLPVDSTFIPGSLIINGVQSCLSQLPTSSISLGTIQNGQSVIVQYQVIYNSMPSQNQVLIEPSISYSYVDSNGANQIGTVTGTTSSLTIVSECQSTTSGCCCCCCCQPTSSVVYNSSNQCIM